MTRSKIYDIINIRFSEDAFNNPQPQSSKPDDLDRILGGGGEKTILIREGKLEKRTYKYTYMKYNNTEQSSFSKLARISKKQLDWLKDNKDTKTIAGFLDKIINHYKEGGQRAVR